MAKATFSKEIAAAFDFSEEVTPGRVILPGESSAIDLRTITLEQFKPVAAKFPQYFIPKEVKAKGKKATK